MKTHRRISTLVILVLAAVFLIKSAEFIKAESEHPDLAESITKMPIFLQPVIWVGDAPPARPETESLWEAIQTFGKRGVEAGLADFEKNISRVIQNPLGHHRCKAI